MARKKIPDKDKQKYQNVALLREDHELLRNLAEGEQRSMARQLSVYIRRAESELVRNANISLVKYDSPD
jgi:hypothetical protein|tara:strand:- start:445 stop:651 length:207 start_codon:yes stop_codon:yes gene_type:complete